MPATRKKVQRAVESVDDVIANITLAETPPKSITVIRDTAEQYPVVFPKMLEVTRKSQLYRVTLKTVDRRLETGDYMIEGMDRATVETKRSLDEIYQNVCTKDSFRFTRTLRRLSKFQYPIIFLQFPMAQLWGSLYSGYDPMATFETFLRRCADFGIPWSWLPPPPEKFSHRTGEVVARWLLEHNLRTTPCTKSQERSESDSHKPSISACGETLTGPTGSGSISPGNATNTS